MHANMFDLHIHCALRRNSVNKGFGLWIPMARQKFNRRVNGGLIFVFSIAGQIFPCHCEGVRSTLKTLAYDCGNPVQYVCGHSPALPVIPAPGAPTNTNVFVGWTRRE